MRLFVAIELPERVRTAAADVAARARTQLPPARWVRPANLHLTLAFLGELAEGQLPRLAAGLESATSPHAPFALRLRGGGRFPPNGRARTLWLGFEPEPGLERLQASVAASLQSAIGYEPERRPFHAHLTLARCAPPWPAGAARRWQEAVAEAESERFRVERVALIHSRLGAEGASYRALQHYRLGGAA